MKWKTWYVLRLPMNPISTISYRYMRERSMLTTLRNYAHYIKHVTFSDDNSTVDDSASIAKFLNQISAAPEVVDDLNWRY